MIRPPPNFIPKLIFHWRAKLGRSLGRSRVYCIISSSLSSLCAFYFTCLESFTIWSEMITVCLLTYFDEKWGKSENEKPGMNYLPTDLVCVQSISVKLAVGREGRARNHFEKEICVTLIPVHCWFCVYSWVKFTLLFIHCTSSLFLYALLPPHSAPPNTMTMVEFGLG